MKATHSIEQLLGTRSRVAVLRVLWGATDPLNTSQVAQRAGLTRPATATALEELASTGVVRSTNVGRAIVHILDHDNAYTERVVAPVFSAQDELPENMLEEIRERFSGTAESAALFGSYARSEQAVGSDVDVVLVAPDAEAKRRLEEQLLAYAPQFRRRWGAELSVLTYQAREAAALYRTAPALFESLNQDAIVIFGAGPWEWSDAE